MCVKGFEKDQRYQDGKGALVFVSTGIGNTDWMTDRQKHSQVGTHRICSPSLPLRSSKEEAQKDLDAYARRKGWAPVV